MRTMTRFISEKKKEDSEKTPEVKGEKNDLGGYDFVFETEAGNLGQKLQYVPHLTEKNEWYSEKDMFLGYASRSSIFRACRISK